MKANEFVKKFGWEISIDVSKTIQKSSWVDVRVGGWWSREFVELPELKRLVESHENLELLGGIKKGKEILDGAPVGSDGFVLWTGKVRYLNGSTKCIFSDKSNEWSPANVMVLNLMISFDAFKDVIADVEACQ